MGFFKKNNSKFTGMYRGKVVDNNDPRQLGRIKVQVQPMLATISTADLPWCIPAMSLFDGAGDNLGSFTIPRVNSFVYVFFEQGDIYQPVYFAEAQTAQKGLPTARTTSYPDRKVWRTAGGIEIFIDDNTKLCRINHPTGTFIEIQPDGNVFTDPITTKRSIHNAWARTVEMLTSGKVLTGDDGGLICFVGPLSFVLPAPTAYEGMEYVFERCDGEESDATISGAIETVDHIHIRGLYAGAHLISGGSKSGVWHLI